MLVRIQGFCLNFLSRLFEAWRTVEWFLPPNLNPINAEGIDVCLRQRYIATCLARIMFFNRFFDFRSPRLTLNCLQITRCMSSTVISFSIRQPASVREGRKIIRATLDPLPLCNSYRSCTRLLGFPVLERSSVSIFSWRATSAHKRHTSMSITSVKTRNWASSVWHLWHFIVYPPQRQIDERSSD